ncbi:MAG: ribonuclease P protein component [Oscillospiraceae bacterium]
MIVIITLKLNKEFKRAYYRGSFKSHPLLTTYMVKNNKVRYGITTSKKIGIAVNRNRARRIIRQAFKELCNENFVKKGDYVFVARSETVKSKSNIIKEVMKKQLNFIYEKDSHRNN